MKCISARTKTDLCDHFAVTPAYRYGEAVISSSILVSSPQNRWWILDKSKIEVIYPLVWWLSSIDRYLNAWAWSISNSMIKLDWSVSYKLKPSNLNWQFHGSRPSLIETHWQWWSLWKAMIEGEVGTRCRDDRTLINPIDQVVTNIWCDCKHLKVVNNSMQKWPLHKSQIPPM